MSGYLFSDMPREARDTSRDRHGLTTLAVIVSPFILGPLGAVAATYAAHKADQWVNENRDKYDPA